VIVRMGGSWRVMAPVYRIIAEKTYRSADKVSFSCLRLDCLGCRVYRRHDILSTPRP
jgi:hypothetical protein